MPSQVGVHGRGSGVRRPRYGYNYPYPSPYWNQGWHQGHYQHPYGDDTSVHSSLSGDYPEFGMYAGAAGPHGHFYPPAYHHPHAQDPSNVAYDPNMHGGEAGMYPMHTPYHPEHAGLGFFGHPPVDPSLAYGMQQPQETLGAHYGLPPRTPKASSHGSPVAQQQDSQNNNVGQAENFTTDHHTPYKYDPSKTPSRSPYWGHLDSTIAMGLSTPQTHCKDTHAKFISPEEGGDAVAANGGQPLLLHGHQSQYYGYGPVSNVSAAF